MGWSGEAEALFVVTLKPSVLLAVSDGVAGVAFGGFSVVLAAKLGCDLRFGDWSAGAGEIHGQGDVVDAVHDLGWLVVVVALLASMGGTYPAPGEVQQNKSTTPKIKSPPLARRG
jgi:hypothetical protein